MTSSQIPYALYSSESLMHCVASFKNTDAVGYLLERNTAFINLGNFFASLLSLI